MPLVKPRPTDLSEEPLEHEIDPELQKELLAHPGKWVALTRSRLIAVGDTPKDVYLKAIEEGVDSPILYHVPKDAHAVYIF